MKRKIVQIAVIPSDYTIGDVYALDSDGVVWRYRQGVGIWDKDALPPLPDKKKEERS